MLWETPWHPHPRQWEATSLTCCRAGYPVSKSDPTVCAASWCHPIGSVPTTACSRTTAFPATNSWWAPGSPRPKRHNSLPDHYQFPSSAFPEAVKSLESAGERFFRSWSRLSHDTDGFSSVSRAPADPVVSVSSALFRVYKRDANGGESFRQRWVRPTSGLFADLNTLRTALRVSWCSQSVPRSSSAIAVFWLAALVSWNSFWTAKRASSKPVFSAIGLKQ